MARDRVAKTSRGRRHVRSLLQRLTPAKVNLTLRVRAKRPDGYHEIESVMVPLTLSDLVEVSFGGRGIQLVCSDPHLETHEGNLLSFPRSGVGTDAGDAPRPSSSGSALASLGTSGPSSDHASSVEARRSHAGPWERDGSLITRSICLIIGLAKIFTSTPISTVAMGPRAAES